MSTTLSCLFALAALIFVVQRASCTDDAIEDVYEKLEAYATGGQPSSGLTADDIYGALEEWKSLPDEVKQQAKSIPLIRLTIDFVVHPMEVAGYQIDDEPEYVEKFIARAERAYRLFRPAYVEGKSFNGAMVRADKFYLILNGAEGKLPRGRLTNMDFVLAKKEFEDWSAQLDHITLYEDVYSLIPYLKKLFNYFNDPFLKTLSKGVFPHVSSTSTVDQLLDLFFQELKSEQNIVLHNGRWTRFV